MQNLIPKFRQIYIISEKPGYLFEKQLQLEFDNFC